MKKETVFNFLEKLARQARANKDEQQRRAVLQAIQTCRKWLELPWVQMRKPVVEKLDAIEQEAFPLYQKRESQSLTKEEQARLTQLELVYETVYAPFAHKISPTVGRAEVNRKRRERS